MESDLNRLFHFTNEAWKLEKILENGEFWVNYCQEDHTFLNEADQLKFLYCDDPIESLVKNKILNKVAYPMVCFCDIHLRRIKNHTNNYGGFGIGMKREWAEKKKISPVQYVNSEGLTAQLWFNIITQMERVGNIHTNERTSVGEILKMEELVANYFEDLILLATYIKPYKDSNRVYYDEREWRYSPEKESMGENRKQRFLLEKYIDKEGKEINQIFNYRQEHENMKSDFELKFDYEDIDCLIVPDERNKQKFIKILKELNLKGINVNIRKMANPITINFLVNFRDSEGNVTEKNVQRFLSSNAGHDKYRIRKEVEEHIDYWNSIHSNNKMEFIKIVECPEIPQSDYINRICEGM